MDGNTYNTFGDIPAWHRLAPARLRIAWRILCGKPTAYNAGVRLTRGPGAGVRLEPSSPDVRWFQDYGTCVRVDTIGEALERATPILVQISGWTIENVGPKKGSVGVSYE